VTLSLSPGPYPPYNPELREKSPALAGLRDDRGARRALAGRKKKPAEQPDPLIGELERVEGKLQKWLKASEKNAVRFKKDPIGAMQAAGLDMEDEIMLELERITAEIARKLR
jgi:tRNA nucleotidyltransferase (CCA-adding enzyme)